MAHNLVKILRDDDGEKVDNPEWHYVATWGDSNRTLCTGEVFGYGEGNAEYKIKTVQRGGITCEFCLSIIKSLKKVKL